MTSLHIEPISSQAEQQVIEETRRFIDLAELRLQKSFDSIPVLFDLRGRNAGMYRIRGSERCIRYNPYLFAKYFDDNLKNTVPHEVAHYVCDQIYGLRNIRPHGKEWKEIMLLFGVEPQRTCSYDLEGVPQRRQQRHPYRCDCREHQLTTLRHNRVQKGKTQYLCRSCHKPLVLAK